MTIPRFTPSSTFFFNSIRTIHCLTYTVELTSQHVLYYHSSRPCPLRSIPHPYTIIDHLLLHCRWYSNLTRFHNSHGVNNYCHIHPSGLYHDNYATSHRNTYFYRHSTRSRNLIHRRRNTSVPESGRAISCAWTCDPSGGTWLHSISADTRKRITPGWHIYTCSSPDRRRDTRRSINSSS